MFKYLLMYITSLLNNKMGCILSPILEIGNIIWKIGIFLGLIFNASQFYWTNELGELVVIWTSNDKHWW